MHLLSFVFGTFVRSLALLSVIALAWLGISAPALGAAVVHGDATGNAGTSADFHGVQFTSGGPGDFISSIRYELPVGFFDFDGVDNFNNQTAPILFAPSLVGLNPSDITFAFTGTHPTTLTANFAPGSFAPGDSFRFAADLDGTGSDLGGVFGASGGVNFTVQLESGPSASAHFTTTNSVRSDVNVTVVPEPIMGLTAAGSLVALRCRRRRGRS